jgi:hypothetical protein
LSDWCWPNFRTSYPITGDTLSNKTTCKLNAKILNNENYPITFKYRIEVHLCDTTNLHYYAFLLKFKKSDLGVNLLNDSLINCELNAKDSLLTTINLNQIYWNEYVPCSDVVPLIGEKEDKFGTALESYYNNLDLGLDSVKSGSYKIFSEKARTHNKGYKKWRVK